MNEIEILSAELGRALIEKNWTVTTAESCTGGGISAAITEVAGSSAYFNCGFITYSNEAKAKMLDIPLEFIEEYGAVSEQVVGEMAKGALKAAAANIAIAVSGIAGPGGGTPNKPVGTVWGAIAIQYLLDEEVVNQLITESYAFSGDRKKIRDDSILSLFNSALNVIKKNRCD